MHRIFKRVAKALIRLRVCVGWSETLLVAHTTLLEISCGGSNVVTKLNKLPFQEYDLDQIFFVTFDFSYLYTSIKKWTMFDTFHFLGALFKLYERFV